MHSHMLNILNQGLELGINRRNSGRKDVFGILVALECANGRYPVHNGIVVHLHARANASVTVFLRAELKNAAVNILVVNQHHDHERVGEHVARPEMHEIALIQIVKRKAFEELIKKKEEMIFSKKWISKVLFQVQIS